jgi:predicted nucleotide-binding protein
VDIKDLGRVEGANVVQLRAQIGSLRPNDMPVVDFRYILLQRYWISQEFTHVYDAALDRLDLDNEARIEIRRIIREEYPDDLGSGKTPSHRENLVTDLFGVGVTAEQLKASRPSAQTRKVIESVKNVVYDLAEGPHSDVRLLSFLRTWGEVLTAVEYEELYPRVEKLLGAKSSVFYLQHIAHDSRTLSLDELPDSAIINGHADRLGERLCDQLTSCRHDFDAALIAAREAVDKAMEAKQKFWAQFATGNKASHEGIGEFRRVFISHGRSQQWRTVQSYIEKDVGLQTIELSQEANEGRPLIVKLRGCALRCDSAVVVMTGDDIGPDGPHVRENVMYETGAFHIMYGLERVVLLYEEGVSIPSNLSGLMYIPFRKDNIEPAFHVLHRELKKMYGL